MRPEDQPGVEALMGLSHSIAPPTGASTEGEAVIREWKIGQLERLGLGRIVAELFAPDVDWHELEDLLRRGCRLDLALRIAR